MHKILCRQNHPLQERPVCRIIFHAVRPVGRCVGSESTCAGSRVLAHSGAAAFLFFKQSIAQCAPLYKPFRQKLPKYRHGVAHGPGGRVRAPRPADNMAAGESGPSGTPAPTHRLPIELRREGVLAGVTDCRSRCAHRLRNDMGFCKEGGGFPVVRRGGALPLPRAG